tara:strand:+ start:221 stop:337 length:117 start_codon:yes stop_codon:yes gene_type:complete
MRNAALDLIWIVREIVSFALLLSSTTLIVIAAAIFLGA